MHVTTTNKGPLALFSNELVKQAAANGVQFLYEGTVMAGTPLLNLIRETLAGSAISEMKGILNGTTNYILTQMEAGMDYDAALKQAQELGYAEADPTLDIEGIDAAHKLTLLVAMAYGAELTFKEVPTEGISGLAPVDFEAAREFGHRIKLLAIAKAHRGEDGTERIEARVHPTLIPETSLLAKVDGAMNAIAVTGDAVGPTLFYGAGAGELPTASAVVADLIEIAREVKRGSAGRVAPLSYLPGELAPKPLVPLGEIVGRHYLRFTAVDRPGVLAHITSVLGEHQIGIESVIQKGRAHSAGSVPVLILTHPAPEFAVRSALEIIDGLEDVTAPTRLVRIEEGL